MKFLSALIVCALALALAGCATTSPLSRVISAYGAITDASVPANLVIVAANSFDAVELTAKNIVVACTPVSRPAACDDVTLRKLITAVRDGRKDRDGLEGFLRDHPGALGSKGLYDGLTGAVTAITQAISDFNGGKAS